MFVAGVLILLLFKWQHRSELQSALASLRKEEDELRKLLKMQAGELEQAKAQLEEEVRLSS